MCAGKTYYKPEFKEKIIDAMTAGKSAIRFAKEIGVSRETIRKWTKKYPDFAEAYEEAKTNCEAYWEEWLINHLADKDLNASLVKLFMAQRFGWTEKSEVKNNVTVTTHEDNLKALSDEN